MGSRTGCRKEIHERSQEGLDKWREEEYDWKRLAGLTIFLDCRLLNANSQADPNGEKVE